MEENKANLQPYSELLMKNAMLDCKVLEYQAMIKCKTDENRKYESSIVEYKTKIEELEKSIQKALVREEKIKNNIDSLRNSRLTTEGLLTSMKHELQNIQEKREETKKNRAKIIDKYSKIFKTFKEEYDSLPWIQKKQELKNFVQIGRINLDILKSEFSSTKRKIILFKNINEQRLKVSIVNLAKLIVERNNLQKENYFIDEEIKILEIRIDSLEKEKVKVKEQKDKKVSVAISQARERAVKTLTPSGIENMVLPTSIQPAPVKESIFARLGFEGPLTLKRITPACASPIPQKLPRILNIQSDILGNRWKQKEILWTKKEIMESSTITSQKPYNTLDKTEKIKEVSLSKDILPVVQACSSYTIIDNPQVKFFTPVISPQDNEQNLSVKDGSERKKNSPIQAKEKTGLKILKNVTFLDEKNDQISNNKSSSMPATKETVQTLDKLEKSEKSKEQVVAEEPKSTFPTSEVSLEKGSFTAKDAENVEDISMDTDTVMSLNLICENKNEFDDILSENLESPDSLMKVPSATKGIIESLTIACKKPNTLQDKLERSKEVLQRKEILPTVQDFERKKKKLKKKVKKNSPIQAREKMGVKILKKVTFLDEKIDLNANKKSSSILATKENVQTLDILEKPEKNKDQVLAEKPIPSSPEVNPEKGSCTTEDTGNLQNISMDTDSMSLSLISKNKNDFSDILSRNIESPDILIQRPPGLCFSPLLGQTNAPEDSEKDKKSVPDFMGSSSSSFFLDDQSKTSEGQTSSFFDFFKSNSPKKGDNSTKSFFQLF